MYSNADHMQLARPSTAFKAVHRKQCARRTGSSESKRMLQLQNLHMNSHWRAEGNSRGLIPVCSVVGTYACDGLLDNHGLLTPKAIHIVRWGVCSVRGQASTDFWNFINLGFSFDHVATPPFCQTHRCAGSLLATRLLKLFNYPY